jgi:ribose transport system substrate-binding protein
MARYLAGDHNLRPYTFIPSIPVTKQNATQAAKDLGQS